MSGQNGGTSDPHPSHPVQVRVWRKAEPLEGSTLRGHSREPCSCFLETLKYTVFSFWPAGLGKLRVVRLASLSQHLAISSD